MGHREDERYYIFSRLLKDLFIYFQFQTVFFFFFETDTDRINGGMALISLAALGSQIAMERELDMAEVLAAILREGRPVKSDTIAGDVHSHCCGDMGEDVTMNGDANECGHALEEWYLLRGCPHHCCL